MKSRLYQGTLRHRRHQPRSHRFSYRVFMPFICLDELPGLFDGNPGSQLLGQITLAGFVNVKGLEAMGSNLFLETSASGPPVVNVPGSVSECEPIAELSASPLSTGVRTPSTTW